MKAQIPYVSPILDMKLSSIKSLQKHGIPRSLATYILNNFWKIPESQRDIFSEYFLLRWEKKHFDTVLKDGTIERAGIVYNVIYYRTDPIKIKNHTGDILLSFRVLDSVYTVTPVVLITLA